MNGKASQMGLGGEWGLQYLLGIPFRPRMTRQKMEILCDQRLGWLLRHAYQTIPFYRELLDAKGVQSGAIRGFGDIEQLPTVSKQALRDAGERAWASDVPADKRIVASTSGSSDQPLTLAYRFSDRLRKHAIGLHCMYLYGWRPWHRGMALGSQALPVNHGLARFGISRWHWVDPTRPVREWVDDYNRVRPQAFHSYPSALREFCFEARGRNGLSWMPDVLSVGGEFYPEELTPLVTEVFGRPPLVMYGAVEGGRLAFECEAHNGLHIRPDAVHLEILENGKPVAEGENGVVHITSLINTTMPIIRYELGDVAAWVPGQCSCGSWWPRIRMQQGRRGDVVVLPGGRRVPVTSIAAVVGKSHAIRQFQFIRRDQDLLVLRFEPGTEYAGNIDSELASLRELLPGIRIEQEKYGQLPRTRTGKVTRYVDETQH